VGNLKIKNGRKTQKTERKNNAQSKLLPIIVGLDRQKAIPQQGKSLANYH